MNNFKNFLIIKGLQPITVQGHIDAMKRIHKSMMTECPTKEEIEVFVVNLYTSDYSYSHKANQVKAIEYWFEFNGDPITFGRQRKPRRLLKDTLSEMEVAKMINISVNTREKAIMMLLAYAGVRPKELCKLNVEDIDFGINQIRINQGKGFKDGIVYIPSQCSKALMKYVGDRENGLLFRTYQGNPYNAQALRKFVKTMAKRAGVNKRVYPYLFRHSLATNMIKRGANILYIKEHFRHAWIDTTMLYVHSIGVQERNEQYFPQYV